MPTTSGAWRPRRPRASGLGVWACAPITLARGNAGVR